MDGMGKKRFIELMMMMAGWLQLVVVVDHYIISNSKTERRGCGKRVELLLLCILRKKTI